MPKAQAPFIVPYICCKVNALTDSWAGRADLDSGRFDGSRTWQVWRIRIPADQAGSHAQQIMNSHIPKKSALIWIFCCLRATCSSLDSHFAKTNIKMGSFLQYIYMIKNGSSQVINFYVILGTITCTVYGFLTVFRFAVPI